MLWIGNNQIRLVHVKYVVYHLRELMRKVLTVEEDQVIMLHCGLLTDGRSVSFSVIADRLGLSCEQVRAVYQNAVIKTRLAIPGSRLEHWINCYHRVHHPYRRIGFHVDPMMEIPCWDK